MNYYLNRIAHALRKPQAFVIGFGCEQPDLSVLKQIYNDAAQSYRNYREQASCSPQGSGRGPPHIERLGLRKGYSP